MRTPNVVLYGRAKIDDFIYYYEYIGMKVKTCEGEGCTKRILIKNIKNTSQKYCKECQRKIQLEMQRKSMKKLRK